MQCASCGSSAECGSISCFRVSCSFVKASWQVFGACSAQSIVPATASLQSFLLVWLDLCLVLGCVDFCASGFFVLWTFLSLLEFPGLRSWFLLPIVQGSDFRGISPRMSENQDQPVSDLVRALNRLFLALENSTASSSEPSNSNSNQADNQGSEASFELVTEEPVAAPRASPLPSISQIAYNDYNSFAEVIPPVPHWVLRDCRTLVAGDYSIEFRAKRAWEAGFWAGLTLQGKVRSPRAIPSISLRPKIYVILRAPGLEAPTRVSNASDFFRITGRLEGSNVVCHSFPSLAEAAAYCEGAGYRLPSQHQWRWCRCFHWKMALPRWKS